MADTLADPVAILDEIAVIEKRIEEATAQLKDAKTRLQKAQDASRVQPGANMSDEEKMALIKVNLAEVLNPEIMDEALKKQGHLKVYWGTATTGRPHCGYVRSGYDDKVACTAYDGDIVRTHPQARTVPRCGLPRQDPPRRHPRLPRQPQSAHRAGQVPRRILPLHHHRAAQGRQGAY
jgi:hypothetical protein